MKPIPAPTVDTTASGLSFPGNIEVCAMGAAGSGLESGASAALLAAGLAVYPGSERVRPSARGNWVAVTVGFFATSRTEYQRAHEVLRALPGVKWTL